jgi:hypothetical protein
MGERKFPCKNKNGGYENLSTEIHRMWNIKYFILSVIPEATGIVTKD